MITTSGTERGQKAAGATDPAARWSLEEFAELVRRYQAGVCAVAFGVTGDRALSEDIAQETFVVAWRSGSTLRDPARPRAWLCGIARNLARKARRRRRPVEQLGEAMAGDDVARDAIARDEARLTWAAMRALPQTYREALVLYYWEDQSARQVAEALGITEATAMQRLSRGRALLRNEVERLVERTLRRARPGAVLTAAILAAVAATAAEPAATAAGAAGSRLSSRLSRRVIWKTGVVLAGLRVLGALGAPIAVLCGRRPGRSGRQPAPALIPDPPDPPELPGSAHTRPSATGAEDGFTRSSNTAPEADAPAIPSYEPDPDGECHSPSVMSDDGPTGWVTGQLTAAMSLCFAYELVDQPCRIAVEVRDGQIARTAVEPFEGAANRVVVRTLEDAPATLAPHDLHAWLAAGKLIQAVRDTAQPAVRDQAIQVGELVAICAKARLEGLPIAGPDGTRYLRFGWVRDVPKPVDRQAYLDLGVATGASRGPASAPVTIVSFLDIPHPWGFGKKAIAALGEVLASYPDDVRVVVKLCPMSAERALAAEAIHAAHAQGALWPMLELVAANGDGVRLEDLVGYAATLKLDFARFRADLEQHTFRAAVELDDDHRIAMEIDGLPSALVNLRRISGAMPASVYLRAVEQALRSMSPFFQEKWT